MTRRLTNNCLQSWKEDRPDVAEHLYNKSTDLRGSLDPTSAESLADVLLDIGKGLSARKDVSTASKWLGRANDIINVPGLDQLSRDGIELRITITRALVDALLHTENHEGYEKASELVEDLSLEIGEKPIVLVLRLEVLQHSPVEVFDEEAYVGILRRMVRTFNGTDSYFKLIEFHIWKLHQRRSISGCHIMDEWITSQIIPSDRDDWVRGAVLRRVSMAITQADAPRAVHILDDVLTSILDARRRQLDNSTALAAVTVSCPTALGYSQLLTPAPAPLGQDQCHI